MYNRIIFPIKNDFGDIIAFGGRLLYSDNGPKYINSAESELFSKRKILYGLYHNKRSICLNKTVLIVEGYLDVMTLYQQGINYAVAPLGIGMSITQIKKLWAICSELTICFDNDNAGQNACEKLIYNFLPMINEYRTFSILNLIGGKDPDDIIAKKGVQFFKRILLNKINLVNYIFQNEVKKIKLKTPENEVSLRKKLVTLSYKINNFFLSASYKKYLMNLFYNLYIKKTFIKKNKYIKYFQYTFEDKKIIKLMTIIQTFPNLLRENTILEGFISINLCRKFNIFRNKLLCYYYKIENFQFNSNLKLLYLSQKTKNSLNIISHKWGIKTFEDAKKYVQIFFKNKKLEDLSLEITNVKEEFLKNNDSKLLNKLIFMKKLQQKMEKKLVIYE